MQRYYLNESECIGMIGIMLLALPIIFLLIGIIFFGVNLWKLNNKTVSSYIAAPDVPLFLDDGGDKVVPRSLAITDDIRIVNSYELDEDEIRMLLYTVILKQKRKNYKIDNNYIIPFENTRPLQDIKQIPSRLLRESAKTIERDVTMRNKEKFICQLQN